jgi:TolA-binding protein
MRNVLVFSVLLILGVKMGWDYLASDKFQAYGDRTKAPWTCSVDFWMGEYMTVLSEYDDATRMFGIVADRCPASETGERAAFELAGTLESDGKRAAAIDAYQKFLEKYPASSRAKLAEKSIGMLRTS